MCRFLPPRMAPLPLWLLWLLLPLGPRAQKLPTRDEELFQMQVRDKAFFHDSSVLPDGAEISSYLFRDTPKRYPDTLPLHRLIEVSASARRPNALWLNLGWPGRVLSVGKCGALARPPWGLRFWPSVAFWVEGDSCISYRWDDCVLFFRAEGNF